MHKWRGHGFGSWDIVCNGLVDGMRHFSLVVVADGSLSVGRFGFLGNTVRSVTSRWKGVDGGWYCVRTKAWLSSGMWPSIGTCLIEGNPVEGGACTSPLDQCRFSTTIECTVTSFPSTQLPRVSSRSCSCYFARDVAFLGQFTDPLWFVYINW
jgi:hypothetical protein